MRIGRLLGTVVMALVLLVSVGCKDAEVPPPTATPSAPPAAVTPFTSPVSLKKQFDIGGGSYPVTQGDPVAVSGTASGFSMDAADFADRMSAWLLVEPEQGKLALLGTHDGGGSWRQTELPGVHGHAVRFVDATSGFALVSDGCRTANGVERCSEQRLLRTSDSGGSWENVWESASTGVDITSGELTFPGGIAGYALTSDGVLLHSTDRGASWQKTAFPGAIRLLHSSFVTEEVGFVVGTTEAKSDDKGGQATMQLEVWKTEDGGAHWQRSYQASGTGLGSGGIAFVDPSNGYVAVGNYDEMNGRLMRTTDGGAHWTEVSGLQPGRPTPMGIRLLSATEGWIPLSVGAGPIDGGLLRFTNGGAQKEVMPNGLWSVRDAVPTEEGTGWAIADSNPGFRPAVLTTSDGGRSWKQVWPSPHPTVDVTYLDERHGFGIGREMDPGAFLTTDDGGGTWKAVTTLGVRGERIWFVSESHGWVLGTSQDGTSPRLLETKDGGATWQTATESIPDWVSLPTPLELTFVNDNEGMLVWWYPREIHILRTSDGGHSWKSEPPVAYENSLLRFAIRSSEELQIAELITQPDKLHWLELSRLAIGTGVKQQLGRLELGDSLYGAVFPTEQIGALLTMSWSSSGGEARLLRTADGGQSWIARAFPAVPGIEWTSPDRFGCAADGRTMWVLMGGHLLLTNDAGGHWSVEY